MSTDRCLEPAPWETRNLGIEAFAVASSFFLNPDEATLRRALEGARGAGGQFFVQARFSPDSRTSQVLEANGFYYVETTLRPSLSLEKSAALDRVSADVSVVLPRRYPRPDLEITSVAASDTPMVETIAAIAAESFVDDRFHADHNCPAGLAGRRYRLWVGDLLDDASVAVEALLLRGEPVAFMASRGGDLLLAGFDRRHANAGLGEFFWLCVLDRLRARGVERVRTRISVANVAVLNLYARLDFKLRDPEVTFHLWGSG